MNYFNLKVVMSRMKYWSSRFKFGTLMGVCCCPLVTDCSNAFFFVCVYTLNICTSIFASWFKFKLLNVPFLHGHLPQCCFLSLLILQMPTPHLLAFFYMGLWHYKTIYMLNKIYNKLFKFKKNVLQCFSFVSSKWP